MPVNPWDELVTSLAETVRSSIPELVELPKVGEFVAANAAEFAKEKWLSHNAPTEQERAEHARNLVHLAAQVKGKAHELAIREGFEIRDKIGRALQTTGIFLSKIVPGLFIKA